jgi:ABC-type transport system substrate-binding protein
MRAVGESTGRKITRRQALKGLGVAAASATLVSRARGNAAAAAGRPNLLRLAYDTEPNIMDPALSTFASWEHEREIYSTLIRYGYAKGRYFDLEPDLATSWAVSPDGRTYTFKLRGDVKFHRNFGLLTSEDVKFSFERIMDPATKSPYRSVLSNVETVAAPDPLTVRIALRQPQSGFIYFLTEKLGWIVSKKAVEKFGADHGTRPETTIGTGPFQLTAWKSRDVIGFERNPDYFVSGFPRLARAEAHFTPNPASAKLAFQAGDLDIIPVTPDTYTELASTGRYTPFRSDTTPPGYYLLNTTQKPLDDLRVRQAMVQAIDHKRLIAASNDLFTPIQGTIVPPSTWGYDGTTPHYEYDPARARALLSQAGYPNGTPEIESPKHNNAFYPWDDIITEMWRVVGIRTKRPVMDDGAIGAKLFAGDGMIISDINGRPPHCDPFFWDKFYSANIKKPFSTGIDQQILAGRTVVTPALQKTAYAQAQRKLCYQDVAVVLGVYYRWLYVAQPYVKNLHDDPGRRLPWATFWIEGA